MTTPSRKSPERLIACGFKEVPCKSLRTTRDEKVADVLGQVWVVSKGPRKSNYL